MFERYVRTFLLCVLICMTLMICRTAYATYTFEERKVIERVPQYVAVSCIAPMIDLTATSTSYLLLATTSPSQHE